MLVYVAGPYTAPDSWEREQNIRRAEAVALEVFDARHFPICVHTQSRFMFGRVSETTAIAWGLELLRVCHAAVLVSGWVHSNGTLGEIEFCKRQEIPVYLDVRALMKGERRF